MITALSFLVGAAAGIGLAWRIMDLHDQNRLLRKRIAAYEEALRQAIERQNLLSVRAGQLQSQLDAAHSLMRPGWILEKAEQRITAGYFFYPN